MARPRNACGWNWPREDAADVAAALSGQVDWPYTPGFQMTLRNEEVARDDLFRQLDNIRERMMLAPGGRDLAVFMFSGHGTVVGEGDGAEFYLLPHGADVSSPCEHQGTAASRAPTCGASSARSPPMGGCWCCSTPAAPAR